MPKNIVQYDLLISCPGDIKNEISIIEDAVSQFNTQFSNALGINIRTKYWQKNSYPQSGGKPQALLNEQFVNACDAAVAILWTRFGTPTDNFDSGTEEEVEIMLSSGKQVFMYFSDKPMPPSKVDEESYKKVQAFRDKYKDQGIYFTYSSDEEFKNLFFAHLSQYFLSEKRVAEVKEERHSELKVVGIDQNRHINDEVPIISFVPNVEMTTSKYLEKIRALFDDISARKLESHAEVPGIMGYSLMINNPVKINENEQKYIYSAAKALDISITEDFFALGNLSQNPLSASFMYGDSFEGTDAEKDKYEVIQKLLKTISKVLEWAPIENAFSGKKCLKLAVQNYGTDVDEDIEISLRIPKNSLLPVSDFPKFENDKMSYLLNDCNMGELFGICSTSTYSSYDQSVATHRRFSLRASMNPFFADKDNSNDYENELAEVFCYSCFYEDDECIVKVKFDYIKHNTTIAFPSIIFITEPFTTIPYTITSKNLPEIVTGEIKIVNDVQNQ
jgi:nucleoside 2-deoxyribosyltransferase